MATLLFRSDVIMFLQSIQQLWKLLISNKNYLKEKFGPQTLYQIITVNQLNNDYKYKYTTISSL